MAGSSIEATLELWAQSLRDAKARIQPLFTQERVAASAGLFLDGLLGEERRKTGWNAGGSRRRSGAVAAAGEIRRIAIRMARRYIEPAHIIAWSLWRRAHQAAAQRAHLKSKTQL
jgi:hypothetical protein